MDIISFLTILQQILKSSYLQGFSARCEKDTDLSELYFVFCELQVWSADNLSKQFGPRSGPTKYRA